jgi:hypothetical protein
MLDAESIKILSKSRVRKFIRERMLPLQARDNFILGGIEYFIFRIGIVDFETYCVEARSGKSILFYNLFPDIIIPPAISLDLDHPERGLWGMIDWEKLADPPTSSNHKYIEGHIYQGKLEIWMGAYKEITDTPYLALLKALDAQIGGEDDD